MLEAVFMFRGRVNRLQYFLAGIFFCLLGVGLWVLGILAIDPAEEAEGILPLLLLGVVLLWIGLSLQAARIRDIGLSPLLVILGLGVAYFLLGIGEQVAGDASLKSLFSAGSIGLQIVSSLFLLLMPGTGTTPDDPMLEPYGREALSSQTRMTQMDLPARSSQSVTSQRYSPPPASAVASARSQAGARASFGRRGL
ncbi:DUF805 domain-containing protein [Peteryoungia ipomoeae]|uniref:DUF805 domain-containing protein n=2 Tax=Peteryoungia ipomoeae TaxID=1210932 RepID=A0A4S8P1G4_9HYPH|nr:DUF805 domain-containing protein [Peteryoungia ipomoeae]